MNSVPTICTIVAKNYISFARVLSKSFLAQHPDGKVWVLIVDDSAGFINPSEEIFDVADLDALGIPKLKEFCFKYNITELSTAVKPYFIEYLFNKINIDKILYLDPDILITMPLTQLFYGLNENNNILITPHLDTDYPDDGMLPNDSMIMKSGIYNLGFIGIKRSETSIAFLKWWQVKLYDRCLIDHSAGYFVDQKYIDYALPLFDGFSVLKDTGYNVAYWNIHSRTITYENGKWLCNGNVLYFYHFSNYKPEMPDILSGYQTRFNLKNLAGLNSLFNLYTELLIGNGYFETKNWPYSFGRFSTGEIIFDVVRKMYRRKTNNRKTINPFDLNNYNIYDRIVIMALTAYKIGTKCILSLHKLVFK